MFTITITKRFSFFFSFLLFFCLSQQAIAQVNITKSTFSPTANPGEYITYTISYNCVSITDPCVDVSIIDTLGSYYTFSGASSLIGSITSPTFGTNGIVIYNLGTLAPGSTGQVGLTVRLDPASNLPGGSIVTNTAHATVQGVEVGASSTDITVNSTATATLSKNIGSVLEQNTYRTMDFNLELTGNTTLTNFCLTDTVADFFDVQLVETGIYQNTGGLTGLGIEYTTNLNSSFTTLAGSPFDLSVDNQVNPSLAAGERIKVLKYCFEGNASPGLMSSTNPEVGFLIDSLAPADDYQNCAYLESTETGQLAADCQPFRLVPPIVGAVPISRKYPNSSANLLPGDTIEYILFIGNGELASEAMQGTVLHDLFPSELLQYVENSFVVSPTATNYSFSYTPNFTTVDGEVRDLMTWTFPDSIAINQTISISYKAVSIGGIANTVYYNYSVLTASNSSGLCLYHEPSSFVDEKSKF